MKDETSELIELGTKALLKGFSESVTALFEKPPVVSLDKNPFAELPPPAQYTMVRSALHMLLAQTMASVVVMSEGAVSEKEIFSANNLILKKYYQDYLKLMRSVDGKDLGEGPPAGGQGSKLILNP